MIKTLNLKAGVPLNISLVGRYLNILVAAGNIRVEASGDKGGKFDSEIYKGCAITLVKDFDTFSFTSPVDQQIKVWISQHPMTVVASETRTVGSANIATNQALVSNSERLLVVEAEPGRARAMLTTSEIGVKVGGANVTIANGLELQPNIPLSVYTEGAIYAISSNGEHATRHVIDLQSEEPLTPFGEIAYSDLSGGAYFVDGERIWIPDLPNYRYSDDAGVTAQSSNIAGPLMRILRTNGGSLWVPRNGTKIDFLPAGALAFDDSKSIDIGASVYWLDMVGDKLVASGLGVVMLSNDLGVTWQNITPAGEVGRLWAQINPINNQIYVTSNDNVTTIYHTANDGSLWQQYETAFDINQVFEGDSAVSVPFFDSQGRYYFLTETGSILKRGDVVSGFNDIGICTGYTQPQIDGEVISLGVGPNTTIDGVSVGAMPALIFSVDGGQTFDFRQSQSYSTSATVGYVGDVLIVGEPGGNDQLWIGGTKLSGGALVYVLREVN